MRVPGFQLAAGLGFAVLLTVTACSPATPGASGTGVASGQQDVAAGDFERGAQTSSRAVVVIEGGGSPHAYTTPWAACAGGRPQYVEALLASGLPVFTAPGFGNTHSSVEGESGCPPQPPLDVQWNTSGYPTQAGQDVLGFLGFLNQTYGYKTFDLVGYSYGGLVARATLAARKSPPPTEVAPSVSYAQAAIDAGVTIPSIVTLNSPHLGAPAYDIADDPSVYREPVAAAWGTQYAEASESLVAFERSEGAGAIQVLRTSAHAKPDPKGWDVQQVGVLDDVAVTLVAGDFCGRVCGDLAGPAPGEVDESLRTDGTVPVYSQLMLPCPEPCPAPPGSVYIPPGLLPDVNVVRKSFPTVHSTFVTAGLGLPRALSVSRNPAAIDYLVSTVTSDWQEAGAQLLKRR
ncbi:MAG: hypothetical protein QG671_1958 [Actinomycetota bacterium]|nr:hypothetical protein [Actinomycetota bacterium]